MTLIPARRAALINGVSEGSATTSNTVPARAIVASSNARSCSSSPPAMPIGVTLTTMSALRAPTSAAYS